MRCVYWRQATYEGVDVMPLTLSSHGRRVIKLLPGERTHQLGIFFLNESHKPMYIRVGKRSLSVSDRTAAAYGVRKRAE